MNRFFQVADLKRLNKLISDQDFFGRKRIRVPVIRHGVLEERIQMEDKQSTHHGIKCSSLITNQSINICLFITKMTYCIECTDGAEQCIVSFELDTIRTWMFQVEEQSAFHMV